MALDLIVSSILLSAASGLTGTCMSRKSPWGQRIAVLFMIAGMLSGLSGSGLALFAPTPQAAPDIRIVPWVASGEAYIALDSLSAFFLVPIFLIGGLGSVYGLGYWKQKRHQGDGRKLSLFWGLLVSGMSLLVIASNALAFLLGWEIMALSAFFLVGTEDKKAEARKAGFVYLIATHVGTLLLFGMFCLWRSVTGSFDLIPSGAGSIGFAEMNVLFLMALFGFGLKAGMMPLHFWLPGAHANAPSHVSAIMSGVVLKMGIYGLVRFYSLLPNPPEIWGILILALGSASALLGVAFAIAQHDLKRLLAYHSVENIGIILMGLGLAMIGRSTGNGPLVVLGLSGCLLHVWNHSLFKSLLFFGAGSVLHGTGTRRIDRLGGLSKSMPLTAALFLLGAVAICGLPPLNGFVSELFVYLGIFGNVASLDPRGFAIGIAAPILAMVGALAVACFVKVYGAVFSGTPRTERAARAHESPHSMIVPMAVIAACCAALGLWPTAVTSALDRTIACWLPAHGGETAVALPSIAEACPLRSIGVFSSVLASAALLALTAVFIAFLRQRRALTWDCGYARPDGRMQYTASSFAKSIVALFDWALKTRESMPRLAGPFPQGVSYRSHVDEPVLDRVLDPAWLGFTKSFKGFHRFQRGLTQNYIAYVLITLIALLCTLIPFRELAAYLFAR